MPSSAVKAVKDYAPLLALLHSKKVKKHVKNAILSCPKLQDVLCLCILNILKGRLSLNKTQKSKLKKYKKVLITLATKSCSRKKKNHYLTQSGGVLPLILGPVLGAIGPPLINAIAGLFK